MHSSDDIEGLPITSIYPSDDMGPLAYVRPVMTEAGAGYGVFAADGTQLATYKTREEAYFAAKQHDLDPVLIH